MKRSKHKRLMLVVITTLVAATLHGVAAEPGPPGVLTVEQESRVRHADCDVPGRDLASMLERARPGDTIVLRGRCDQQVAITVDRLRLVGDPGAVLDGGEGPSSELTAALTIDGAQGVEVEGLTIESTSVGEGILGTGGAEFTVREVVLREHGRGMLLDDASAELDGVTIIGGFVGFQALAPSSVVITGVVDVSMVSDEAFSLIGAAGEVRGGNLSIHDNQGLSLVVVGGSVFSILGFEISGTSTVSVTANAGPGILLGNGALEIGGVRPGTPVVESSDNAGPGIVMVGGGKILNAAGWGRIVVAGNPIGIDAGSGSVIWANGGIEIHDNFARGLVAADSTVTLEPGLNPISITGNGPGGSGDVVLSFGARSTIVGATVGSPLVCDPTVLSRGDTVCP